MTTTIKNIIDPAIAADVQQLQSTMLNLAKKGGVELPLIEYCQAQVNKWTSSVTMEIILLTEQTINKDVQAFAEWLPVKFSENLQGWFDSVQQYSIEHDTISNVSLFHIYNYTNKKIDEPKPVIKVVFYDANFLKKACIKTALDIINSQPALCIFLTNEPDASIETWCKDYPDYPSNRFINLIDNELSFDEVVNDEKLLAKIPFVQFSHYMQYLQQVNTLIGRQLSKQNNLLFGKSILNYKKQALHERKNNAVSSRDGNQFKAVISKKVKNLNKTIDDQLENLEGSSEAIAEIKNGIQNFVGFKEVKGSRNITIKIPQTAINYKSDGMQQALQNFYEGKLEEIQGQFVKIENSIKEKLAEKEIHLPAFKKQPVVDARLTQQPTAEFNFEKPYEKQIAKKGIGQLLMDLRTPIFMLMPFMMIAGVFGSLMGGKDIGQIDEAMLFKNSRLCIAITELPQSSNNAYRVFIEQVDAKRKKGFFNKEIEDELLAEPQLAVISSILHTGNNRKETVEELDYDFDDRKHIIYLYLTENADRQFVKEQLFNPSLALLNIPGKSNRMMGISGLARALSGLSDYRYFIIGGLLALVAWFVVTRKKSMKEEYVEARQKEQKKLRLDLKNDIERAVQQSNNKWKSRISDYLSDYQNALLQFIETEFSKGVNVLKETKIQESNTLQKRINQIKTEKRNFSSFMTDQQRSASKLLSLQGKIKRLLNRTRR